MKLIKNDTVIIHLKGQCLAKPGTLKTSRNCAASLYVLKEDEGGRKKPFANGYRP